jgi:hypothetical protein
MPHSGDAASAVVGGANRFSSSCRKHTFSRAPSLHGHYPASPLLWAPPTPGRAMPVLCLPPVTLGPSPPPSRASQVPRQTCPHAPSPLTPESPVYTHARYSYTGNRLRPIREVGRFHLGVTRPKRVRLRYGSCVRRSGLRPWDYSHQPPDCLHGERASTMATTFQVARSVRLSLTHRMTRMGRTAVRARHARGSGCRHIFCTGPRHLIGVYLVHRWPIPGQDCCGLPSGFPLWGGNDGRG